MINQEIIETFNKEFDFVKDKFKILDFKLDDPNIHAVDPQLSMPGVYVIWNANEIIKVGESLENSRKRLLNGWARVLNDDSNNVTLFNVKDLNDKHWVAALEIYFENRLEPKIPSDRQG